MAVSAAAQEIRPTLEKIKETGVIQWAIERGHSIFLRWQRRSAGRLLDRSLHAGRMRYPTLAEAARAEGGMGAGDTGRPRREARQRRDRPGVWVYHDHPGAYGAG